MTIEFDSSNLAWDKVDGLLPAVVQNAQSGKVLMLGYMNQDAIDHTLKTGHVTFYSRTKQRLWTKGETSGNTLNLVAIEADCDNDTLLIQANPIGPTCHTGTETCWGQDASESPIAFIADLEAVIASRKGASADSSYTASLFAKGTKRIAQKVGEEGVETALAATVNDDEETLNESADLLYHLLVLLQHQGLSLAQVVDVLKARHKK
ncbi:bifunctional phosphoribosyl-AMP cyclohydrolase/phosphoribosyl-ATP diphosphatase HisIE [Neiella sp. HB171785]|uniref:Histidine biosynthesis bifunctional protein HisIE n=1 Tax=Neiella litorisoli TaxID=2771431 RepID=A0A8J6QQ62_9GAMM|nr:bifunctional phosphoribosyl-AMP cyclohydrolase/phosphoribosyl-ATP diphosphatase HisIE [Neiella litorisoli]MBD1388474.1 bifunctional phosphoribosyl-AMP cyclohydrolase/phosphoribosyl-ATP diphosphatase HisIE [Neiella litorisoli]